MGIRFGDPSLVGGGKKKKRQGKTIGCDRLVEV